MYSFGSKRNYGEKAKQHATKEKVAHTQTVIMSEQQLEDPTDLIYNQMRSNLCHKLRIPSFHGKIDHDAYLEWETEMELVFNYHYYTEAKKVKLAATGFCGYAIHWWERIASTRRRNGELQIASWFEMKAVMKKRFAPGYNRFGYVQDSPHQRRSQERSIRSKSTSEFFTPRTTPVEKEPEKKNRSQMIQQEEDIEDPIRQTTSRPEVDTRPINEAYKPDLKELSNDSTCSRNSTHQEVTKKKNWSKIFPHEEDMQLTSWQTSNEHEQDQRLPIEEFQSNQDEPSSKITCFGNLTHQRFTENWIHFQIPCGLKVIQLINQEMLGLPYLEAHGFNHLQTRIWRPGEAYNHSVEISDHPGGPSILLEGSDLRTNPFKGGGDGVILISLNFKDLKINHESSNHDYITQQISYHGHYGRAKTHLVHAETRDGRISLLSDRSELVRPPEQLEEAILVFDDLRHVSAQPHTRDKALKAQKDTKDELDLIMEKPKRVFPEQSPFWPIKLKDRPPWASTIGYGRGPRIEEEEWVNLLV